MEKENRLFAPAFWEKTSGERAHTRMTKIIKAVIFFINMSIELMRPGGQVSRFRRAAAFLVSFLWGLWAISCQGNKEEIAVIPPPTSPLSRAVIGFGVINVSYTYITAEPADGGVSPGYLRRGSLVRIIERRIVKNNATAKGAAANGTAKGAGAVSGAESWVLVDGAYRGWLREALVDIYDNEGRALTAAESMSR
jgi:hypothetical protein